MDAEALDDEMAGLFGIPAGCTQSGRIPVACTQGGSVRPDNRARMPVATAWSSFRTAEACVDGAG